jgi:predicted SnoaL-like aldol condensation-catalyzing enzyme
MRHAVVPFALILALIAGIFVADLGLVVLVPPGAGDDASANGAVVHRFYAAIDAALSTGDVAPLDRVLAANFVDHTPPPGVAPDRSGLEGYLQVLHATEPDLWLTPVDAVAEDGRVAARVRVEGTSGTPVSGLPPFTGHVWSTVDLFRVASGRIVEHWADEAGRAVVGPLLTVTIHVESPATKFVEVDRLTYPPRTAGWFWASGPTILLVESGNLSIDHDAMSTDAATVVRTTASSQPVPPGDSATLTAGNAVILGRRSRFRIRNDAATLAHVLILWAGSPGGPRATNGGVGTGQGTLTPPATSEVLAGGVPAVLPVGRATVTIGRIALAPGAALARHRVANAEFAVVESGVVVLTVKDGRAWERETADAPIGPLSGSPMTAGAGVALDAGTTATYRPAGSDPVTVLLIAIGPAAEV